MSKQRIINTSFWSDSYIENLWYAEKLLFLYLLTNELVDLCWIYEISIKKIGFETSLDIEIIKEILNKFSVDSKIYYFDWYIYIKNFQKHQKTWSLSIEQWIKRSMDKIPQRIKDLIQGVDTLPPPSPQGGTPYFTIPNLTIPNYTIPEKTEGVIDNDIYFRNIELNNLFLEFVKNRNLNKTQAKLFRDKLDSLSRFDDRKIKIAKKTIMWWRKDFFKLSDNELETTADRVKQTEELVAEQDAEYQKTIKEHLEEYMGK